MSEKQENNFLIDKWDLYYHLPQDKNWSLNSYKIIMTDIDEIEKVIAINETIPENVVKYCMLFLMRKGITPMWEDPKNREGGCFSFKIMNKFVHSVWKSLFYSVCGETLCIDKKYNEFVNGITISPKKNFCTIKIWMKNCSIQDPHIITSLHNLTKQGCIFKKHEPEF